MFPKHPTQPRVIVAFPFDLPELTSSEASNFPRRPHLSDAELMSQAIAIVTTPSRVEITILKLMQKYSFSLQQLIDLLRGIVDRPKLFISYSCLTDYPSENKLDVSFSRVKYMDIAPLVGLEPGREGNVCNVTGSIA